MPGLSSFSPSPDPAGSTAGAVMAVQGGTQHAHVGSLGSKPRPVFSTGFMCEFASLFV